MGCGVKPCRPMLLLVQLLAAMEGCIPLAYATWPEGRCCRITGASAGVVLYMCLC